jgi:hypothetical protein
MIASGEYKRIVVVCGAQMAKTETWLDVVVFPPPPSASHVAGRHRSRSPDQGRTARNRRVYLPRRVASFTPLQHPVHLGEVEIAEQGGDHTAFADLGHTTLAKPRDIIERRSACDSDSFSFRFGYDDVNATPALSATEDRP